jgi:hypothetical protein
VGFQQISRRKETMKHLAKLATKQGLFGLGTLVLLIASLVAFGSSGIYHSHAQETTAFNSQGTGDLSNIDPAGCSLMNQPCTYLVNGSAESTLLGQGSFTATISIDQLDNGCATATVEISLFANNQNILSLMATGEVCQSGDTLTFSGSYSVSGGPGPFSKVSGSGSLTFTLTGATGSYSASGTLTL